MNQAGPGATPIITAIESIPSADVTSTHETVGKTTIDFYFDRPEGVGPLEAAAGGRFGSSVVVDTTNGEVITATLRLGEFGLPAGADLVIAKAELLKAIEETDPPAALGIGEEGLMVGDNGSPIGIRFRDLAVTGFGAELRREGSDILHIIVNERVDAREFAEWLPKVPTVVEANRQDIIEFATEMGDTDG